MLWQSKISEQVRAFKTHRVKARRGVKAAIQLKRDAAWVLARQEAIRAVKERDRKKVVKAAARQLGARQEQIKETTHRVREAEIGNGFLSNRFTERKTFRKAAFIGRSFSSLPFRPEEASVTVWRDSPG